MALDLESARRALRERQGSGARYDSPSAPARELAWARQGTAYFARHLNETTDEDLRQPSRLPGWSRAEVVAHVGYNARALTRLLTWAATGTEHPMYASAAHRAEEIARGATLPARALRHLVSHSTVHLDVEWRDLPDAAWNAPVRTAQGRTVPARETAWMRTREVWVHSVDLGGGGRFDDFPPEFLDALAADVFQTWNRRGEDVPIHLVAVDRPAPHRTEGRQVTVTGRQADLVRWLTGRGGHDLVSSSNRLPDIPSWL
ncbi:maleylpyruvate isomerase family mycothiol-dependent enzyme [Kineococcus esterisolvens]|uniref:maleylpyruvate isomerase family mycothiol-dependent enzyme n=1 Tax=unclassified Kineococcus TaxID=2621656 RepID=UPI003D7E8409